MLLFFFNRVKSSTFVSNVTYACVNSTLQEEHIWFGIVFIISPKLKAYRFGS